MTSQISPRRRAFLAWILSLSLAACAPSTENSGAVETAQAYSSVEPAVTRAPSITETNATASPAAALNPTGSDATARQEPSPEPTGTPTPTRVIVPSPTGPDPTPTPAIVAEPTSDDGAPTGEAIPNGPDDEEDPPANEEDAIENSPEAILAAAEMVGRIDALLDGRQGRYSVVVMTPRGVELYSREAEVQVEAASLYKLAVMVEVYRQLVDGTLNPDEPIILDRVFYDEHADGVFQPGEIAPVEALIEPMLIVSSNVAAHALLDRVGHDNANQTMAGLGLENTEIRWGPRDEPWTSDDGGEAPRTVTSAADMARLYQLLVTGQVVDPETSEAMLDLLKRQRITNRLPARLPEDVVVAHKTGNLPGMVHDAGVIYTPTGPIVVAVLTEGVIEGDATSIIGEIGDFVYQYGAGR